MIVDELPGFEGVADLLPTNLLRGFFAFGAVVELCCSVIVCDEGNGRSAARLVEIGNLWRAFIRSGWTTWLGRADSEISNFKSPGSSVGGTTSQTSCFSGVRSCLAYQSLAVIH